jgi:hypothetical protein
VYRTVVFVRPCCVGKEALNAEAHFFFSLLGAYGEREPASNFNGALRKIFRDVEENLSAIVRGGFGPGFGLASGFDGVANIFAIAERGLAEQFAF